jgi:hypothetical protein
MATIMADQTMEFFVIGQTHSTVFTTNNLGTGCAVHKRGVSASIE